MRAPQPMQRPAWSTSMIMRLSSASRCSPSPAPRIHSLIDAMEVHRAREQTLKQRPKPMQVVPSRVVRYRGTHLEASRVTKALIGSSPMHGAFLQLLSARGTADMRKLHPHYASGIVTPLPGRRPEPQRWIAWQGTGLTDPRHRLPPTPSRQATWRFRPTLSARFCPFETTSR